MRRVSRFSGSLSRLPLCQRLRLPLPTRISARQHDAKGEDESHVYTLHATLAEAQVALAGPVAWEPEVGAVAAAQDKKASAQARANAIASDRPSGATDPATHKLGQVLRSELERQCAIGAGTFTVDDGFAQSGLWQVSADLDSGSLIAALVQAQN